MIHGCEEFDLFVCSHDMYDIKDYYTLSRKGVTHFTEGQHSFTPMSEWLDELQKLQKLREISIFKNFRIWKPLGLLRKAVTFNRQSRASNSIRDHLFTINVFLRNSLAVTLECTNGIRAMNIIVTQEDVDELDK